ncbi:MAG TPA: hypothetical protein VFP68_22640 [Burkholderiaceae bacterium]|nr:hypothetical protein [Burkholderiaceae bacterium]
MTTSYILGNLVGRLLMSYLLVLLGCLAAARGDRREAFRRSLHWYGISATVAVFLLGLAGTAGMNARH